MSKLFKGPWTEWYFHIGEGEVVPDDEVPDWVWARLAQERLTA